MRALRSCPLSLFWDFWQLLEFTIFNLKPTHLKVDSSFLFDSVYLNLTTCRPRKIKDSVIPHQNVIPGNVEKA